MIEYKINLGGKTMNIKKVIIFLIILILLIGIGYFIYDTFFKEKELEITPQEEISQEQLRQTIVTLYFRNIDSKELMPEARRVDVNVLVHNPYESLLNMLIEGPKNENLERIIPEGTIMNNIELKGDIVYIDFSEEFIENHEKGIDNESATIYSIVNTLTELTEVSGIKILINGEEGKEFQENGLSFSESFVRIQ